jgi:plastocyanin
MSQSQQLCVDPRRRAFRPAFPAAAGRLIGVAILVLAAVSALAAGVHRIAQKGRAFSVSDITIAGGDTVQFTNDDEFFHQIYVDSSKMNFDSDEQPPGQTIEVKFPVRGTFPVRCHIHPKMLLTVRVQ